MNIITKQISELKPYKNNPKIHTEKQIEQIAKSIELTKGLRQPIVIDKNNVIVCGHGRYLAAKKLGYDTVPCELVNDLTDDEIRAYRLIDNRISEGEYDLSLEFEELSNISLDLSGFEFPTIEFPKEEQGQERERDGYFGDARENTYKSTNFDRYDEHRTAGYYQMPIIKACNYVPTDLIGFNYVKSTDKTDCGVHFFIDDYQFERVWNSPDENIELLRKFQCVLTPDWSLYMDMPMALKVWNVYRQRLIGQIFQDSGLTVIPTLSWAEPETYNFCFDGIEQGGTVAVSTVGVMKSESAKAIWADGMGEAMKRLKPKNIICYGSKIDFDFSGVKVIYFKSRQFGEGRNK